MPRKGRRELLGKWPLVEQVIREAALAALQKELHSIQRAGIRKARA